MAYFLVKYIYKKYKARKQAHEQLDITSGPPLADNDTHDNAGNGNSSQDDQKASSVLPSNAPTDQPSEGEESHSGRTSAWFKAKLLIALAFPVLLETLDYTVVATAQPQIASSFNSLELQSYIGTAYLLSSTVCLPLFASIADIYGRHACLQVACFFFLVGSAISTGAISMNMMLAGRGIAGIGAAGLLTSVRIILADSRSLDDLNWQQSLMFLLYAVGFSIGPVIGGYLVAISFRWVFAINLPCVVVSMVLSFFILRGMVKKGRPNRRLSDSDAPETALQKFFRIDWVGIALFIAGGILILLALNWGSTGTWSTAKVIVSFVIGGVLFIACLAWEHILELQLTKAKAPSSLLLCADPMLPLEMFRSYDVCTVEYGSYVSGIVMLVMFYFVAIFMTIVTGLSPADAGIQLVYFAPGMGIGSVVSITMLKILRQPKYSIILGSVVLTVAMGLVSMAVQENKQSSIKGFMIMSGIGVGLSAGPLAVHARLSQPASRVAIVGAMTLFFRTLGGTVGLAQCATVMNAKVVQYLLDQINSGAFSASDEAALAAAEAAGGLDSLTSLNGFSPTAQQAIRNAFSDGVRWAFISLIPWCGVAVFTSVFLSNVTDTDRERRRDRVLVKDTKSIALQSLPRDVEKDGTKTQEQHLDLVDSSSS